MKKTLPILIVSLLLTASWAMAQTASLAFDDNVGAATSGTYNQTDTITLDAIYTAAGGTSTTGTSFWLETETGVASALKLTGQSYFTFTTAQDGEVKPWAFTGTGGVDAGFLHAESATQTGDAGGTGTAQPMGTYDPVATLTFSLTNATPGIYHIETTHLTPLVSEGVIDLGDAFFASQAIYTFTVVPEPATWSLMGLGGLGSFGLTWLRARKRS